MSANIAEAPAESLVKPIRLARGTSLSVDLQLTRRFHEEFLGLECVMAGDALMLTRDRGTQPGGRKEGGDYWVLETRLVDKIENPQCVWNHWGIDVATPAEVDAAHKIAQERKDYFGIDEIQNVRHQHGAYSFYFSDVMGNWWEVQCSMRTRDEVEAARKKFL